MQALNLNSNLFVPNNFKYVHINRNSSNLIYHKNFKQGLQNARNLLNGLESSLKKSMKYEEKLLKCKMSHDRSLISSPSWNSEGSDTVDSKYSNTDKSELQRSSINLTESWSTMSIVCLQYQYEELSRRYETLLQSYDKRRHTQYVYEGMLLKLRRRLKKVQAELIDLNTTIVTVGEKYLALKEEKWSQKVWYEERIERLKIALRAIVDAIEQARLELS